MNPMVSICTVTYRHARYLETALDSFLAQKTNFAIEILIHDDASDDGTVDIIRRYAALYPDIIKPLYETENQYAKGISMDGTFNYPRARGKYIALCEGDDYWRDPGKLQAQVDYMEAHPDCTFCFTNGYIEDQSGLRPLREFIPYYDNERAYYSAADHLYELGDMCGLSFVPTASYLFPRAALKRLPPSYFDKRCEHDDLKIRLFLTAAGYGYYLHRFSCVYRENVAGSAFQVWKRENAQKNANRSRHVVEMLRDVDAYTGGKYSDGIAKLKERHLFAWLWNDSTRDALRDPEAKRMYRALPLKRRAVYRLKRVLPRTLIDAVKKTVRRGER